MTIEELIDFIDNDNYCSDYKCLDDNCKECQNKYIDKFLTEHDRQIRAEAIDKCVEEIIPTLYELDVEQSVIDIVKRWFEQLKEQKGE